MKTKDLTMMLVLRLVGAGYTIDSNEDLEVYADGERQTRTLVQFEIASNQSGVKYGDHVMKRELPDIRPEGCSQLPSGCRLNAERYAMA